MQGWKLAYAVTMDIVQVSTRVVDSEQDEYS